MRKIPIIVFLFTVTFLLYCISSCHNKDYYNPPILAMHPNGQGYVGSLTCMECHSDIYDLHLKTAHFNTSAMATRHTIKGSFRASENILDLGEDEFHMQKHRKSFYQRLRRKGEELGLHPPQRMDIVIGSGVKGQSYLTWKDDALFQLQASYYPPDDIWINSPGFPVRSFERPIRDACLKCHVTFAKNKDFSGQGNKYEKDKFIYGVDCESCHNPAAQHVIYHRNNPDDKEAKFMLKMDTLSRHQRLDACGQCHSGPRDLLVQGNSFSYYTGEILDEYSRNYQTGRPDSELDVHGNQYGLLTSSQCFTQTSSLDCGTCHDPHKNQRGDHDYFNQKCNGCHTAEVRCSAGEDVTQIMEGNCISCHMPNTPSKFMTFQLDKDTAQTAVFVRTHLIGIYDMEEWHN